MPSLEKINFPFQSQHDLMSFSCTFETPVFFVVCKQQAFNYRNISLFASKLSYDIEQVVSYNFKQRKLFITHSVKLILFCLVHLLFPSIRLKLVEIRLRQNFTTVLNSFLT